MNHVHAEAVKNINIAAEDNVIIYCPPFVHLYSEALVDIFA